jgi:hypothetical protein
MRLYRITMSHADLGTLIGWAGSKREANSKLAAHQREREGEACGPEGVESVEVPTDKLGLIAWLNAYLDVDND